MPKKDEWINQTDVQDHSGHEPKFGVARAVKLVIETLDEAYIVVAHAV